MKAFLLFLLFVLCFSRVQAQEDSSDVEAVRRMVHLSEVVVRSDLNIPRFLQRIKNDTTFYKAFRNLRVMGFTAMNDIRMRDKRGRFVATLQSKTRQRRIEGCRTMEVLEEKVTGDIRKNGSYNYYTAALYASLFFTEGKVCGEHNIVKGIERNISGKKGLEKHKEQLKMMFFNPGRKIPGIPFIGDKLDIFDQRLSEYYDYFIDLVDLNGATCYLFRIKVKEGLTSGEKSNIVFDNITTWFHARTMEIVARNYDLSYNTGLYDFDVHMEVVMTHFGSMLVPLTIRYSGNWDLAFRKREQGIFTATLFDFEQ